MNDLCTKGAVELARMICSRQVASTEVIYAYLARIEEVNPTVNAVTVLLTDEAALRLLASQTSHRVVVHLVVLGDGAGRFTSRQPPPRLCLLAGGEGRLTPEIGPELKWPLQTQKGGLTHDLVRRAAKLGRDAAHGKSGLAIIPTLALTTVSAQSARERN